jgi:CxxC motif-containing protein (DUF1111 family)
MVQSRSIFAAACTLAGLMTLSSVVAVSPASVDQGKQLFEHEWQSRNPLLGNDGLGPLFNAKSCVACHHQGGIGGGGDARFNAHAIGIERIDFVGSKSDDSRDDTQKRRLIKEFYPGLVQPGGSILNSAPVQHHGGSIEFVSIRNRILKNMGQLRSEQGGAVDADGARWTTGRPIYYDSRSYSKGSIHALIEARLFQRNTTALFGAGLIDAISEDDIRAQVKFQRRHSEISGRASILRDGSMGRFGWRANVERLVDFVEQACANELSLETESRPQSSDPGRPGYRNPSADISNQQVELMSEFVGSLPRPIKLDHRDPASLSRVSQGQTTFDSVGCAVCHLRNMGPAKGIYSDILLHDMGPNLYDHDAAGPHVTRVRLTSRIEEVPNTRNRSYYGAASQIATPGQRALPDRFTSPRGSAAGMDFVRLDTKALGRRVISETAGSVMSAELAKSTGIERTLKASNTTQEWRTPPLWGVRDSAPYMHDGRAETLLEAIAMHDGESAGTRDRFLKLPIADRHAVIAFLETLVAPPIDPPSFSRN